MTLFSALATLWQVGKVGADVPGAVIAADAAWRARGPIAALRAFAANTQGQLDDQVLAELELACRTTLEYADHIAGILALAADPKVAAALDNALRALVDLAFRVGDWRAKLRLWLEEADA